MRTRDQQIGGRGLSALIIDDDPFSRKLTRGMLDKLGFEPIWEAGSGEDGLSSAAQHTPDVILLDWVMPQMSGSETLRRLKAIDSVACNVPVVVTSETAARATIVQTASQGASAVVIKPFATATLGARIVRALSLEAPSNRQQLEAKTRSTRRQQHRA